MFMSHIYFTRRNTGRIEAVHIENIQTMILPGDVLITRRNWAATNISIPGFWKHMSMYI